MLVDKVFNSIVASKHELRANQYTRGYQRDIWYNKKSFRGRKMVYYYGAALWEMAQRTNGHMYFITLTTRQFVKDHFPVDCFHVEADRFTWNYDFAVEFISNGSERYEDFYNAEKNKTYSRDMNAVYVRQNNSDEFYYAANKRFLRGKGYSFICCTERQSNTQDLHFHLLCFSKKRLFSGVGDKGRHCLEEIKQLSRVYDVVPHPSLYDIREITDFAGVVSYSSKCFGNHNVKGRQGYCSIFNCRTFSASRSVSTFFRENASMWLRRLTKEQIAENPHLLVQVKEEQFCRVYEFSDALWNMALDHEAAGWHTPLQQYSRVPAVKGVFPTLPEKINRLTQLKWNR